MKNKPILIFDSGIWSYSVVKEIIKDLPNENIIYLADRKSFPYWAKNKQELKENMLWVIKYFEENFQPKIILIASNTPSIQVLDELKRNIKTQLFWVFPPIKKALEISKTWKVAILATKSAVESSEINDYIKKEVWSDYWKVLKVNASDMVWLIEPGTFLSDPQISKAVCKKIVDPYLSENIDVITLSSTHLPFLKSYLNELYPDITLLDPAQGISQEVKDFLIKNNLCSDNLWKIDVFWTQCANKKLYNNDLQQIFHDMWFKCEVKDIEIF